LEAGGEIDRKAPQSNGFFDFAVKRLQNGVFDRRGGEKGKC